MFILAIDQSTSVNSVALLSDETVVTDNVWHEATARNQHLFAVLDELFKRTGIEPSSLDLFAVGLGPGAFSGLRISLSAISGMALPDSKLIFGVSSAEALAWDIIRWENGTSVAVVGDARRGALWQAVFEPADALVQMRKPFSLVKWEELPRALNGATTIVTPDWDRIGDRLCESVPDTVTVIREKRTPTARSIGNLALARIRSSESSMELKPIYLHPPVFIEPRFADDGTAREQPCRT